MKHRHNSTLLLVFIGLWVTAEACEVKANDRQITLMQRLLAADLARVNMNESLGNEADLAMIWQIVQARGTTNRDRRSWLRAHSPCVTGRLSEQEALRRPGNCRWTRNLQVAQREPPDGFTASPGYWSARILPVWRANLRAALEYVLGDRQLIVCPETPETWDGPTWREQAEARGWRALDCKGTRNIGYVRASL